MFLSDKAIQDIVKNLKEQERRVKYSCDYLMQIVEMTKAANDLQGFKLSDGFSQIKLFIKTTNANSDHFLTLKSIFETHQGYPIIRLKEYVILNATKQTDDITILAQSYEITHKQQISIIGSPINYKDFEIRGFINENGSREIEEDDIDLNLILNNEESKSNTQFKLSTIKMTQAKLQQNQFSQSIAKPRQPSEENVITNIIYSQLYPISMLNNLNQHPFRGRIIKKDDLRFFKKKDQSEGKLFSIHILDEDSLAIATFFDQAADKFFPLLNRDQIYRFEGAQIKIARNADQNRQIGAIPFDLIFEMSAQIIELDDIVEIKLNKFSFLKLNKIRDLEKNTLVDLICIISSSGTVNEFTPKNKNERSYRRALKIFDDTQTEIEVTLYGNYCSQFPFQNGDIYQFKNLKVSEYQNQKSLQSSFNCQIYRDNEMEEVKELMRWLIDLKVIFRKDKVGQNVQLNKMIVKGDDNQNLGLKTIQQMIFETQGEQNTKVIFFKLRSIVF